MGWFEIARLAGVVVAAAVAGGLVYKRVVTRKSSTNIRVVTQNHNTAGGDIVGGDSVKRNIK